VPCGRSTVLGRVCRWTIVVFKWLDVNFAEGRVKYGFHADFAAGAPPNGHSVIHIRSTAGCEESASGGIVNTQNLADLHGFDDFLLAQQLPLNLFPQRQLTTSQACASHMRLRRPQGSAGTPGAGRRNGSCRCPVNACLTSWPEGCIMIRADIDTMKRFHGAVMASGLSSFL